jgi:hypothetical protein
MSYHVFVRKYTDVRKKSMSHVSSGATSFKPSNLIPVEPDKAVFNVTFFPYGNKHCKCVESIDVDEEPTMQLRLTEE